MTIQAQRLRPGDQFRSGARTATVLYVVPDMRVRVKWHGIRKLITIGERSFWASTSKADDLAPTAEVEAISATQAGGPG